MIHRIENILYSVQEFNTSFLLFIQTFRIWLVCLCDSQSQIMRNKNEKGIFELRTYFSIYEP